MFNEWFGWPGAGSACILLGLASMACGPDLYVMQQTEERVDERWFSLGGGCQEVTQGGASGSSGGFAPGAAGPGYEDVLSVHDGIAEFTIRVDGEVVEHRIFDEEFLRSGKIEQVLFEVPDSSMRRYSFWGAPECETPSPDDLDAYEEAKQAADAG